VATQIELNPAMRNECRDPTDPHIVIAMSGGVDSSVAAVLLKRAGYRVSAVFMKNWNEPAQDGHCEWEDDVNDVLSVCDSLDIEVNTVDLSKAYWDGVFEEFLDEYRRGRTPNPDVLCNREVKFKAFLEHASTIGGDLVATGHYAKHLTMNGTETLHKGADLSKDQSYFLYAIGQRALTRTVFPLGNIEKLTVRQIAADAGLVTHAKKDSTGICFIGERRFRSFLSNYLPAQSGDIRDLDGTVIGSHEGAAFYTLGQREGLGIGGVRGAAEGPWFVVAKDVSNNELIAAQGHEHPLLMSQKLSADTVNWIGGTAPTVPFRCHAKTRYRQSDQSCQITAHHGDTLEVEFTHPQRAVTPGQSVVFYDGNICLGGGIINATS
jgi:tRNA-specific 2-thiouridylase